MLLLEEVVLVNERDEPIGTMEKMAAHEQALLHRAFSIFIFNQQGDMLLQQRALSKYHSGGLYTNACCSHPRPNELVTDAAQRRLFEEMGFVTPLQKAFTFTYKAAFDNGLTEYEFDHVFVGQYEGTILPDPLEVATYCYKNVSLIEEEIATTPNKYTAWFLIAFPKVKAYLHQQNLFQ
jgi:isopentenyl-diphosphate Delta-isomerase